LSYCAMVKCAVCAQEVYTTEEVKANGKVYHQPCFKCANCKNTLAVGGVMDQDGMPFCLKCHSKLYTGVKQADYEFEASTSALDSDIKSKQAAKYDMASEEKVRAFIESILGIKLGSDLGDDLKDGMILCNLINTLRPGVVTGHKKSTMAFTQMENISKFLKGLNTFGFKASDQFMTVDLFEKKNMGAVVDTLLMLGRKTGKIV